MLYCISKHLAVLFILLNFFTEAAANTYQDDLKTQVIVNKLYENAGWLALLHYRRNFFSGGYSSEADNPKFFFSSEGVNDPRAELTATIDAMFLPENLGDEHPQCTFPARFSWFKKNAVIDLKKLPAPDCNRLENWKEELDAEQVAIVFPTSYLNNPSSMFGHLFLRFESSDRTENKLLMDYTINFAADVSAQKGVMDYIYRGLFGGFPSVNSIQRFYRRFKRYSDIESRDIWEYRLNLTSEELDMLILHVWELRKNTFDYYFLDENCAYRIIALIEVARPDLRLIEEFKVYTIPVDTIRKLKERGVIQSSTYRTSALKIFYHHLKYLTADEKKIVVDIVRKQLPLDSLRILSLPVKRRVLILTLASEYLNLLINKDIIDRKVSAQLSSRILAERIKYYVSHTSHQFF